MTETNNFNNINETEESLKRLNNNFMIKNSDFISAINNNNRNSDNKFYKPPLRPNNFNMMERDISNFNKPEDSEDINEIFDPLDKYNNFINGYQNKVNANNPNKNNANKLNEYVENFKKNIANVEGNSKLDNLVGNSKNENKGLIGNDQNNKITFLNVGNDNLNKNNPNIGKNISPLNFDNNKNNNKEQILISNLKSPKSNLNAKNTEDFEFKKIQSKHNLELYEISKKNFDEKSLYTEESQYKDNIQENNNDNKNKNNNNRFFNKK